MKKALFFERDGLWAEYTIAESPKKNGKFSIFYYKQYQACRFNMLAFNGKTFNSRSSASIFLFQHLNILLDCGEISEITFT